MTDAELLAIIIGSGNKNLTALEIAEEILRKFNSYKGIAGQEMTAFLEIKGIDKVRFTRIAACWAIAGRIVKKVLEDQEKYGEK
jgi:DNA repair protein RadC